MAGAKFQITRKCEVCGELFIAKTIDSRYCSPRCSKIASKRRKKERENLLKLDEVVKRIPKSRTYITVTEAYAMFGISRDTIYRLIRKGAIPYVNCGQRQTRIDKEVLLKLYPLRETPLQNEKNTPPKLYRMEPEDCYTIGEVSKKFHLDESTVYLHIRKFSIPTRQIGNYVYVPKKEIDNLYKGMKI